MRLPPVRESYAKLFGAVDLFWLLPRTSLDLQRADACKRHQACSFHDNGPLSQGPVQQHSGL